MNVDELNPSQEDVKPENELAEIEETPNPETGDIDDSPQDEDNSDASNDDSENEGESLEAEKPVEDQPPRKQSKTSKRFQDLANKARLADERAQRAEQALEQLSKQQEANEYDEFDMDSVIKNASHETAKIIQENNVRQAREDAAQVQQEQVTAKVEAFAEAEAEFASKVLDYQEAMGALNNIPQSKAVAEIIIESERGPEVAYYLAKHPNEAREVVHMSPMQAAKFIGGIEARLTATPARTTTKAPKPVPKLSGKSGSKSKNPAEMTQAEYEKWRLG